MLLLVAQKNAAVAELADALDSGSSPGHRVGVQVPSAAPNFFDNKLVKTRAFLFFYILSLPAGRLNVHSVIYR